MQFRDLYDWPPRRVFERAGAAARIQLEASVVSLNALGLRGDKRMHSGGINVVQSLHLSEMLSWP